jgi:cbb3-type cytochrome oxidase maturation protein
MDILYILIPIAIVLVAAMVGAFLWAARSGQFDDLEGPAHRILMDEDEPQEPVPDRRHSEDQSKDH